MASENREITVEQAAEILNVPQSHLTRLLEAGEIPWRTVDGQSRLCLNDVLRHKDQVDAEADGAFADLVAQAQELRLGYE